MPRPWPRPQRLRSCRAPPPTATSPTQESLLLEVALHAHVDDLEALVAEPVDADHAAERALDVLHRFNERVLDEEVRYRNAMRVYQELWFNASGAGDPAPIVREGRRARWFRTLLAPLRDQVGDDAVERLVLGLCVLGGMEAMTALRDVCRLSPGEALAVTDWAAARPRGRHARRDEFATSPLTRA